MFRSLLIVSIAATALEAQTPAPAAQAPAPAPEIYFRAPADGASVAQSFVVMFGLRNYGVAPAGVNAAGTGHFHIVVNKEAPAVGTIIPPNDSVYRHFGSGAIETTLTLPPGTYTLRVVLGDFEHRVINANLVSKPIRLTVRK